MKQFQSHERRTETADLTRSGSILRIEHDTVSTPDWFVEPGANEGYRPWQHTPLLPYSESVRHHQKEMYAALLRLVNVPEPTTLPVRAVDLVRLDFASANARRQTACAANVQLWQNDHPDELEALLADQDLKWTYGEALDGHASPAGLLQILRHSPSLASLDLQVLTTPYGYRREHMHEMRAELVGALQEVGGQVLPQSSRVYPPKVALHPVDTTLEFEGDCVMFVTQKQLVGTVPALNGDTLRVMEREAYSLLLDYADDEDRTMLAAWNESGATKEQERCMAQYAVKRIHEHKNVLPLSMMTYAYREVPKIPVDYGPMEEIERARQNIEKRRREAALAYRATEFALLDDRYSSGNA